MILELLLLVLSLYLLIGFLYGIHSCFSNYSILNTPVSKILLFYPYYILEDIFKGVK